jgi:hypothetical protein
MLLRESDHRYRSVRSLKRAVQTRWRPRFPAVVSFGAMERCLAIDGALSANVCFWIERRRTERRQCYRDNYGRARRRARQLFIAFACIG